MYTKVVLVEFLFVRPGSVVGIATAYGLDVSGIELSLLYSGYRVFPGVSCGGGVTLTPHTLLVLRSKIEWSYISTLLKGLRCL
jgi:hypothetical protein